jgi:glycerol-3-phosphate dehydrogenase (NAD(P)+)
MQPIVVLGAGSWGTALAIQFARSGGPTVLWGRAEDKPEELARTRENVRYLPGAKFPPSLAIEPDLARAIASGKDFVLVVPSSVLRIVLEQIKPMLAPGARVAWASKGFELDTGKLPHQVAREVLGPDVPIAVLSGPTFAQEVGRGLPTAIAVASPDDLPSLAERISSAVSRLCRPTSSVEIGGAVRTCSLSRPAVRRPGYAQQPGVPITRGLAELMRLGVALGAKRETLMGLAGLGDLVLTCTDDQSRNRRFGRALAAGKPVDQAIAEIGQVVEGYHAAKAVHFVAEKHDVDMPICNYVYDVLHRGVPLKDVVASMLAREVTPEN